MDLVTQQLHERRERILETARALIGEIGYQALTMRELAARCRVSVPTLYNQFGSKNELLATAVQSHFSGLLGSDPQATRGGGHMHLIAVVRLCASEMTRLPDYHRALIGAFMGLRDTDATQATLISNLTSELAVALAELRESGQLRDWLDIDVLAEQITQSCIASSVSWAIGVLDDERLEASMLHAACCLTLCAAQGAARKPLEREAQSAQRLLAERNHRQPGTDAETATAVEA